MKNSSDFSPERNNHESVTLTRKTYQSEITLPDEFFETADDGPGAGEIAVVTTSTPLLADPSSRLQTSSNRGKNLEAAHLSSVMFEAKFCAYHICMWCIYVWILFVD